MCIASKNTSTLSSPAIKAMYSYFCCIYVILDEDFLLSYTSHLWFQNTGMLSKNAHWGRFIPALFGSVQTTNDILPSQETPMYLTGLASGGASSRVAEEARPRLTVSCTAVAGE